MIRIQCDINFNVKVVLCFSIVVLAGFSVYEQTQAQQVKPDTGNLYPMFRNYADRSEFPLSYLSHDWPDIEQWRIRGRAKMQELLSYETEAAPLEPEILETLKFDGHTRYLVRYTIAPGRKTEAFLLIPNGLDKPAPAVLALHDHGAFYYFGKEKHTSIKNPPRILKEFIDRAYDGRTYAEELVKRGFVVLCPDAFYFGS